MVKVNKKPILEHIANNLNKAGVTEIIVNVNSEHKKIFDYFGPRFLYLYEPVLFGEKGTEMILSRWLGEEYLVINGDTLTNLDYGDMIQLGKDFGCDIYFYKERYGGTKLVRGTKEFKLWDGNGAYYFDCGTPKKLAKARRYYANIK